MVNKSKLEYIWLDGHKPTQSLRSKTRVENNFGGSLEECPVWAFDGSSTEQATGDDSDCILLPTAIFPDPCRKNGYLVMNEVLNDDRTPHESNGRAMIDDDDEDFWFGFEQEYFLWDTNNNSPPGFPSGGYPGPQGPYYCSVGAAKNYGRPCVEDACHGGFRSSAASCSASPPALSSWSRSCRTPLSGPRWWASAVPDRRLGACRVCSPSVPSVNSAAMPARWESPPSTRPRSPGR